MGGERFPIVAAGLSPPVIALATTGGHRDHLCVRLFRALKGSGHSLQDLLPVEPFTTQRRALKRA